MFYGLCGKCGYIYESHDDYCDCEPHINVYCSKCGKTDHVKNANYCSDCRTSLKSFDTLNIDFDPVECIRLIKFKISDANADIFNEKIFEKIFWSGLENVLVMLSSVHQWLIGENPNLPNPTGLILSAMGETALTIYSIHQFLEYHECIETIRKLEYAMVEMNRFNTFYLKKISTIELFSKS